MADLAFDLRYLRYASVAAEHGNLRRAAVILGVPQSTVSRRVQLLEHRLGFFLFERDPRGVRLTSAGENFLKEAAVGVHHFDRAVQLAASTHRGERGELHIGILASLTSGFLQEFLEYAASGTIQHGRQTGQEPDSDFERWFLSRLKSAGYTAHPQVGVAKYRIDIGIVHPDKPGSYIIGFERDGATYHSSRAARDRDRLRQSVLEELNWRIYRVWSTDWYRDPEREFARLIQKIESSRDISKPAAKVMV
jgi:very-short-patch-repair endonuclease